VPNSNVADLRFIRRLLARIELSDLCIDGYVYPSSSTPQALSQQPGVDAKRLPQEIVGKVSLNSEGVPSPYGMSQRLWRWIPRIICQRYVCITHAKGA